MPTYQKILFAASLVALILFQACGSTKDFYGIPAQASKDTFNAVIEIPAGTNKKYEYDPTQNNFVIDLKNGKERIIDFLPYPGNYGFIPSTLSKHNTGGDGDALDVLVISESVSTRTVLETLPIAILKLIDAGETDYKIIAVPKDKAQRIINATTYAELRADYPKLLEIIELWFLSYNPQDTSSVEGWGDEKEAMDEIKYHVEKYNSTTKNYLDYSFFTAGHVYGTHGESEINVGVHPPFKEKLHLIKNDASIAFGVLTGDIVYDGASKKEWEELDADVAAMGKTVYFAPGNHDIGSSKKRAVFTERYGPSYQSFTQNKDLFILLDTNLDPANISGEQLTWLKNEIQLKAESSRNIFVFFHHVLWWQKDNRYKSTPLNSTKGRNKVNTFFKELYPMFEALPNEVFLYAGDTGAYDGAIMYDKTKNITLIASGMGGRKEDNFVITRIKNDGSVIFDLIALNGKTTYALGRLEEHALQK